MGKESNVRRRRLVESLILKQQGFCALCDKHLSREDASLDHIFPVSLGGRGYDWNLRATHRECNSRRGNLPEDSEVYRAALEKHRKKGLVYTNVRLAAGGPISSPMSEEDRVARIKEAHLIHAESLRRYVPNH